MTAYVLVADAHTGGWVWDETAALLREAGASAHPITLAGMGAAGRPAGPGTSLDTHIADVVRAVDAAGDTPVVLVGHGYGIHPALGAADRRPARVVRVVHLDAGLPKDGDPPLALIPDPAVHRAAGEALDGARDGAAPAVPPPAAGEWGRWGSTAGVPARDLARLAELGAPQPVATLTQPLRRTGAARDMPMTGVLCTAGGARLARVEAMIAMGDPHLARLAAPGVTFFELDTGHWPMLSAPADLVRVLLAAAAGEGHRIVRTRPPHLRPFLLDVPERRRERTGRVDLYPPDRAPGTDADTPRPAVLFVHGGPVPEGARPTPRDWPVLTGYAGLVASYGAVAATVDHRLHGLGDWDRAAADVTEAIAVVRADPRVDPERVALWYFSAGGLLAAGVLAEPPSWLRCLAVTYPVLAPLPGWGLTGAGFRPAEAVRGAGRLPLVLTRAGAENPEFAATVAEFTAAALACGAALDTIDAPGAPHGFETTDHSASTRAAVLHGVRTVLRHLGVATPDDPGNWIP